MWARICPVCRQELPERGNRRVYVSWKRGFRLVHAGACFDAIDAQGVLELDRRPGPLSVVWVRRYRAAVASQAVQLTSDEREHLLALHRAYIVNLKQVLVGDEDVERVHERRERVLRYARWYLAKLHAREVSAPARTELLAVAKVAELLTGGGSS